MNLFKKTVASIALVALVSGIFSTGVSAYSTAQLEAANDLAAKGIINAQADAAGYNLDQNVLRQEIAAVARGVAGLEKTTVAKGTFSDVTATSPNNWAVYSVEALADAGLIAKNATFRPEDKISKAEAIGMVVKAAFGDAYAYDAAKGTSWQEQVVAFAVENGVAANFTNYDTAATRGFVFDSGSAALAAGETADEDDLLGDLLGGLLGDDEDETDTETDTDTETPVVSGDNVLTVTLSPETPDGGDLPNTAKWVAVAAYDVTAGSEDVTINSAVFKRTGLGSSDAVTQIAVFENAGRASKVKTFNSSSDDATVNFSPAVVVKAGETKTLVAKVNTSSTGNFAIELDSLNATSTIEGENILGNEFEVQSTLASTWSLSNDGSVTSPKLGEDQAELFKFKFKNDSASNEDITLTEITLKENGTIDEEEELANVALYHDGEKVAEVASLTSKYVTFDLGDGVEIKEGKTEKFLVKADVIGWASKTVDFYLDNVLDVSATASKYGYVNAVNTDLTSGSTAVTVQAGEITISATDASNTDIRKDKNDVEFGRIKITANAGKDLELQELKVQFVNTDATSPDNISTLLENVELYDETNGTVYDLTAPGTAGTTEKYTETSLTIAIANGAALDLIIRADTKDTAAVTGAKITASIDVSNDVKIVELEDDTEVSDKIPAAVSFKTITGVASSVTINNVAMSTTKSAVIGSTGVEVLNFEVKADNDASDLTVDEIKVKGNVNDAKQEVTTITVSGTATAGNQVIVTAPNAYITATIAAGTSATAATAIAAAINADSNYTATATDSVVTVTAASYQNETDITIADGNGLTFVTAVTNGASTTAASAVAAVAQVDTVTLAGTSGTANVTLAGGLTKLATFNTDLTTTASDFVTAHAAAYAAVNITVTSAGADLIFTSATAGTAFTSPAITNVGVDLAGTVVNTTANVVGAPIQAVTATTVDQTRINALYLYEDDTLLDKVSGSQLASGVATFNGFKINVPKNSSKRFMVKADFIDDTNQGNDTVQFQLTGYSVEDDESDNVYTSTDRDSDGDLVDQSAQITSARVVTIKGVGTLANAVDTTDSEVDKDKNILGGVTSGFVASYELTATNEAIEIKDFTLTNTNGVLSNAVSEVIVYANDKTTEVARETVVSGVETVTFDNANFVVAEGTSNVYVKVITHKQGKDQAGQQTADLAFTLTITDAEWDASGKDVTLPTVTGNSKNFSVNSTRISAISFVNQQGSVKVADKLAHNTSQIVAILAVTTDSSVNTDPADGGNLKTVLDLIEIEKQWVQLDSIKITKINGSDTDGQAAAANLIAGTNNTYFDTTLLTGSDAKIDNGTTAYFKIEGTPTLTATDSESLKISVANLDDGTDDNAGIEYKSDGSSNNTLVTSLRLWDSRVDGITISE